jgi:hypothetical protein
MVNQVRVNASLDRLTDGILEAIAAREAEDNKSLALRMLLREAGARRGLLVAPEQAHQVREVQNANRA